MWRGTGNSKNSAIYASVILMFTSVTTAFPLNSGLVCPTAHSHFSLDGKKHVTVNMSKVNSWVPHSSLYLTWGTFILQCSGPKRVGSFSPTLNLMPQKSCSSPSACTQFLHLSRLHWLLSWYKSLLPDCTNALLSASSCTLSSRKYYDNWKLISDYVTSFFKTLQW